MHQAVNFALSYCTLLLLGTKASALRPVSRDLKKKVDEHFDNPKIWKDITRFENITTLALSHYIPSQWKRNFFKARLFHRQCLSDQQWTQAGLLDSSGISFITTTFAQSPDGNFFFRFQSGGFMDVAIHTSAMGVENEAKRERSGCNTKPDLEKFQYVLAPLLAFSNLSPLFSYDTSTYQYFFLLDKDEPTHGCRRAYDTLVVNVENLSTMFHVFLQICKYEWIHGMEWFAKEFKIFSLGSSTQDQSYLYAIFRRVCIEGKMASVEWLWSTYHFPFLRLLFEEMAISKHPSSFLQMYAWISKRVVISQRLVNDIVLKIGLVDYQSEIASHRVLSSIYQSGGKMSYVPALYAALQQSVFSKSSKRKL